ncbi:MAG: hypothetical protein IPG39_20555, partial [Bacteroidetes bacterium]|nr:hypothetical protein [Bacteroidota bacterium]
FERVKLRWQGLQRLRAIIGDHEIEYEPLGGYEVFTPADEASFELCRNSMNEFNIRMEALASRNKPTTVCR